MAHWYTAPVHDSYDPETGTGGPHPCPKASSFCRGPRGVARVHAYAPPEAPTTCLVGTSAPVNYATWTPLTLQEAQEAFEAFYGRAPTELEVY